MSKNRHTNGQTLLEAVVALAALTIVLSAISAAVISSISNSTFVKNQDMANKYAQEGIEYIKSLKERERGRFNSLSGNYCLDYSGTPPLIVAAPGEFSTSTPCDVDVTTFVHEVSFAADGCDSGGGVLGTRVTVAVRWTSGKCAADVFCHNAEMTTCFTEKTVSL